MALVMSGLVRVECDAGRLALGPSDLFFAPPGSRARLAPEPGSALSAFSFRPSLVDAFASESSMGIVVQALASKAPRTRRLQGADLEEASFLFSFIARRAGDARAASLPSLRLEVMGLLALLGDAPTPGSSPSRRFRSEDLRLYIEERYAEQFSLDDLGERFGHNPSYVSRTFSQETGSTIVEYLNRVRIRKSCALLKRSSSSVLEIAYAVGYNSLSHFNQNFRRIMGMSPREYRCRSRT
jgi:AraC-like DNA-binding protein